MIAKKRCLQHLHDAMAELSALDALSLWPWKRRISGCSSTPRCNDSPSERPCFIEADQPDYWNQVYKVQSLHGRSLYEWYGLGGQLSFVCVFFFWGGGRHLLDFFGCRMTGCRLPAIAQFFDGAARAAACTLHHNQAEDVSA